MNMNMVEEIIPDKRSVWVHAFRGLHDLPHVGPHPGILWTLFFIVVTGLASVADGGIIGFIGGALFSSIVYVPMLIMGSIGRSKTSDKIARIRYEQFEKVLFE